MDKSNLVINILLVVTVFLNFLIDFVSFVWSRYILSVVVTPSGSRGLNRTVSFGASSATSTDGPTVSAKEWDNFGLDEAMSTPAARNKDKNGEEEIEGIVLSAMHHHSLY